MFKLLKLYVRQRRRAIILFCLCAAIFLLTFFLYDLPMGAVAYPIALCTAMVIIVFILDIRAVCRKHGKLVEISRLPGDVMEHLPDIDSQDDADYQAIIEALRQEKKQLQTDMTVGYNSMMDYYTTWVHQIKTPIAGMKLILQNEDSNTARQLSDELWRIEQYVEMVLAYLRLDSDGTDYVFREYDIDCIIKGAVKKFASQFIRKKLKLCYEPLHIKVLTDEKWLSFVIEQVLSNALKYTSEGSISIYGEVANTLCIRDTGMGISQEDLPRVFERNYTGYNGRTDKKASGIGLYLCRRICDNLGHDIAIDSSPEKGTTVRIYLGHKKLGVE